MKKDYPTKVAYRIAGFKTPMMLDYLCRSGVITPTGRANPGRGRTRRFSFGDLVLLRVVRGLLEAGVQVAKIKKALNTHQKKFSDRSLTRIGKYLLTDGVDLYLHDDPMHLINLNKDGQFTFAFMVDIHKAQNEIQENIKKHDISRPRQRAG